MRDWNRKLNPTTRPIDLRGFEEVFHSNMSIDESVPMDQQSLSEDMMCIRDYDHTIDVGYYHDNVIVIHVMSGLGWGTTESIMELHCKTYDQLYEQLNYAIEMFAAIRNTWVSNVKKYLSPVR